MGTNFIRNQVKNQSKMSYEPRKKPKYELTSKFVLYFKGKSEILSIGDVFTLAGFELSTFGNTSPFHYMDGIIRLPNSILRKL